MPETTRDKRAAALQYDPKSDTAPVLSAFGQGFVAEKIIETAQKTGVPIKKDVNLAHMLAGLSVGDEIPPELYEVVARVLLFVSEVDQGYGKRIRAAAGSHPAE